MSSEDRFDQMEAAFKKLCQNREQVPLEVLQTRYAKAYGQLVDELKGHVRWYIDDMAALRFRRCDDAGSQKANEWLDKQFDRIKQEEQQPGKAYEKMCEGLIGHLSVDEFMEASNAVFQRMEQPYQKYWNAHCIWTGPQNNRWIYNAITKKFWLPSWPENHFPDGCWIKADYSEPDTHRPPPQIKEGGNQR